MCLVRVHALNTLARPADQRETCLSRYRLVWADYAASFTAIDAERKCFADALDRATRDMIVEIVSNCPDIPSSVLLHMVAPLIAADPHATPEPRYRGEPITLEELRPIIRKIIGQ
jgi:hypothetical protein